MRFSVRTNTALLAAVVLAATLLTSVLVVERGLRGRVLRDVERRWLEHLETTGAVMVAYVAAFQTAEVDREFLQEYVRRLGEDTGLAIRILDETGACLADSQGPPAEPESYRSRREVRTALTGTTGSRFTGAVSQGTRAVHVALPVIGNEKLTAIVHVSRGLGDETETAVEIRRRIVGVAQWAVALALLAIAVGCWWLFRPLARLAGGAEIVAAAEVPAALPIEGSGEVATIAAAVNALSGRLIEASRHRAEWMRELCEHLAHPVAELRECVGGLGEQVPPEARSLRAPLAELVLRSERLARLVDDASLLERLDAGAQQPALETLNVREVAVGAADQVRPWAEHRHVEMRVDAPPTTATFQADRRLLLTALTHLLENAVRFSVAGSEVILEAWNDEDATGFKVIDRGKGMANGIRDRALERFFAAAPPDDDFPGGAGLGLPLARHIAEAHGGTLELLSQEAAGTAVTVTLPVTR